VGARYVAEHLTVTPTYVIVVDMIGDADQKIYWERTSDRDLQPYLWRIANDLGYGAAFIPQYKYAITDDHTPFLERGIRAIDIIDFDYPYWHTTQDTPDKVSAASLERVGRVLQELLENQPYK
jgi:Zn-dependent M28 family amino/carboxypeptidase